MHPFIPHISEDLLSVWLVLGAEGSDEDEAPPSGSWHSRGRNTDGQEASCIKRWVLLLNAQGLG